MNHQEYKVADRTFRTETDYRRALRDEELIRKLQEKSAQYDVQALKKMLERIEKGEILFQTVLGEDFTDELRMRIREQEKGNDRPVKQKKPRQSTAVAISDKEIREELKKQERNRKWILTACVLLAVVCFGYLGIYSYFSNRTSQNYQELIALKQKDSAQTAESTAEEPVIHYTQEQVVVPPVLEEYKNLLNRNKKLIGWVKIDDTNIDYPVMQTTDNTYYLDHNLDQEYDKNGSIFMDKDCDVLKPSTNLILYGHHMKSGKMFGSLNQYEQESYYEDHKYINFDTIYEKGIYQVMYVFRSRVYSEEEIVFKYYQFIDAVSEAEFDSNMREMAAVSLYDTGVTANYGDRLLTLSTCDYQEKNGRFVVVAKKVTEKE